MANHIIQTDITQSTLSGLIIDGNGKIAINKGNTMIVSGGNYLNVKMTTANDFMLGTNISDLFACSSAAVKSITDSLGAKFDTVTGYVAGNGLKERVATGTPPKVTFEVKSKNDSILVDANGIQVVTVDNLTTNSTTKPLTANQGLVLKGLIDTANNNKYDKTGGTISGSAVITGSATVNGTLNAPTITSTNITASDSLVLNGYTIRVVV